MTSPDPNGDASPNVAAECPRADFPQAPLSPPDQHSLIDDNHTVHLPGNSEQTPTAIFRQVAKNGVAKTVENPHKTSTKSSSAEADAQNRKSRRREQNFVPFCSAFPFGPKTPRLTRGMTCSSPYRSFELPPPHRVHLRCESGAKSAMIPTPCPPYLGIIRQSWVRRHVVLRKPGRTLSFVGLDS